jgi:predicted aspartyl protease
MKIPFSRHYLPPAPVLRVSLATPGEPAQLGPYEALVDTGADGTFIPASFLEELDVPVAYATNVRSHLGENIRRVSVHRVDVLFDSIRLPGVDVVSDDWGNEIIIGRNVLNRLRLLLDGPDEAVELME